MKKTTCILLVICVIFASCQKSKTLEIISEKSPFGDFYMTVDTVSIPISEKQTFIYSLFGTVTENDSLYFLGYNQLSFSIDIFNLTSETYSSTIHLNREGPNGIPEVISFTPVTTDSLYIMSSYQIALVNNKGEIRDKISINNSASPINGHQSDEAYFWVEKNEPIQYSKKHNRLYGLYHSMEYGSCDKRKYQHEQLVSAIDLDENQMFHLPVAYPADKRDDCYGFMPALFTTWDHDSLLYNFRHDPNIYLYDLNRDETTIFDGKSQYTKNSVRPISWNLCEDVSKKLDHSKRSVNFEGVIRDPYRKLYYRFHRKELAETSDPSEYIYSDKKLFISIFDNGLAKTGEMILDSRPYPTRVSFPTARGLFVAAPSGENTLNFHVFKVFLTKGNSTEYGTLTN